MKKNHLLILLAAASVIVLSCKKKSTTTTTTTTTPTTVAVKSFDNVTFNNNTAFFSTDGSMSAPVDSNQAKGMAGKIDITFIFNFDYTEPGFFDPVSRSQHWYWDDYYSAWLSGGVKTQYYGSTLTKVQFDAAKTDKSKIGAYFADTTHMTIAPHGVFPNGSCIGGRTSAPNSLTLSMGQVYGFKNVNSGKRGLLYIRTDQATAWPQPVANTNIKVDIIREL